MHCQGGKQYALQYILYAHESLILPPNSSADSFLCFQQRLHLWQMTILIKRCCEGGFWQAMQRKKKGGREAVAGANNSFQNRAVLSLCRGSSATNNHPPCTWAGQNRTAIPTEKITQPYLLLNLLNLKERFNNTSVFCYMTVPQPHTKHPLKMSRFSQEWSGQRACHDDTRWFWATGHRPSCLTRWRDPARC